MSVDLSQFPFAVISTATMLDVAEGKSIIDYGPPKSGKTYALSTSGLSVIHIDLDGSSSVLEGAPNIQIIRRKKGTYNPVLQITYEEDGPFQDVREVWQVREAVEKGLLKADLVVIDSWSRYAEMYKKYVVEQYAPNRAREVKGRFGAQSDWGDWQDMMIAEVKAWHSLTKRGENSINVMHIFHSETGEDNFTRISMQGKYAWMQIMSVVDAIFYQYKFIDEKDPSKVAYPIATQMLATGMVKINAEVRTSARRERLPNIIWPVDWADVLTKMGAKVGA